MRAEKGSWLQRTAKEYFVVMLDTKPEVKSDNIKEFVEFVTKAGGQTVDRMMYLLRYDFFVQW
jgi:hypothetical protein